MPKSCVSIHAKYDGPPSWQMCLVYYWRGQGTKYTAIIFKKQAIRKMGFPVLRTTAEIADAASNSDELFVNSSQIYFLFTEIDPFFPLQAVPNIYMCLPCKWLATCGKPSAAVWGEWEEGDSQFQCRGCSWESSSWHFKLKLWIHFLRIICLVVASMVVGLTFCVIL